MTEVGDIYLCEICGNKVKVLESGVGTLICCGEPMKLVGNEEE
ncbi:MAG: desulfoferrodoxin FeS4 iron-binding domain-containing protein [Candidatus Bathyarchaeia archaeon]